MNAIESNVSNSYANALVATLTKTNTVVANNKQNATNENVVRNADSFTRSSSVEEIGIYSKLNNVNSTATDPTYKLREENISRFVAYNQNGNWFTNGSEACKATTLATVASINSGNYAIRPDKVGARSSDGYLSNPISTATGPNGHLTVTVINDTNNVSANSQLNMIKKSLREGNAIGVEVTTNSGKKHWVTVTGTVKGCNIDNIKSIDDLVGIDPWYGRCSLDSNGSLTLDSTTKSPIMNLGTKNKSLGYDSNYGYITVR